MSQIEGRASYKGEPLKFGTVMFQNAKGGQPAIGVIQADGSFKMTTPRTGEGVKPGSYLISVSCYENQDPTRPPMPDHGDMAPGKLLIPKRYMLASTSGLTAEVKLEANEPIILELTD